MSTQENVNGINTNISYFSLRKIIGWSGVALPWVAWLFAWSYEPSISDYYYTRSGVLFTSVLTLLGAFLISYRGFEEENEKLSDNIITWFGGICIIIVAIVPTPYTGPDGTCPTPICHVSDAWGAVHFVSAILFFIAMSYLSIVRFTRGIKPFSDVKLLCNMLYRFSGYAMLVTLLFAGVMFALDRLGIQKKPEHLVLWVEIVMLSLFGASWAVKGLRLNNTVEDEH
jgi:hypothetical protein